MNYLMTIGISFKNPGPHFAVALKSIFAQTFESWELILFDDGSTDGSLELARQLSDRRVRVYSDGSSKGLNIRLNELVELATAPYFVRMDADDVMHPLRLEKQYQILCDRDINTVVGSAAYSIDQHDRLHGVRLIPEEQSFDYRARHSFIHPTVAASTAWFRNNPYHRAAHYRRAQDAELWCRTTYYTKFINLSEPLLYYRESDHFSLYKYIKASISLLHLIHDRFRYPVRIYVYLLFSELAKLILIFICVHLKMTDLLIQRRCQALNDAEQAAAIAAFQFVRNQTLPLMPSETPLFCSAKSV